MDRIRVDGKSKQRNTDFIAILSKKFGLKHSTVMSYWKDVAKEYPDKSAREIYAEVETMIEKDSDD